jgi:hypothetical protein
MMKSKIKPRSKIVKTCILFLAILLSGLTHAFCDDPFDGGVSFNPSFPMTRSDISGAGLPISGLTYSTDNAQGTNGSAQVDLIGTEALWFANDPASVTNSITTISDLQKLINASEEEKIAGTTGTNVVENQIKFQGLDALEISGKIGNSYRDRIIMFWVKSKQWQRNTIFIIDAKAQKSEVCKTLIKSVTIHPPKNYGQE